VLGSWDAVLHPTLPPHVCAEFSTRLPFPGSRSRKTFPPAPDGPRGQRKAHKPTISDSAAARLHTRESAGHAAGRLPGGCSMRASLQD